MPTHITPPTPVLPPPVHPMVASLSTYGYPVDVFTLTHFRVYSASDHHSKRRYAVDFYPVNKRFHVIHTKERGSYADCNSIDQIIHLLARFNVFPVGGTISFKSLPPLASTITPTFQLTNLAKIVLCVLVGSIIGLILGRYFPFPIST